MITFSDNIARKPYLGSTEIAEVWLGNVKVYPDTPTDYSLMYFTTEGIYDENTVIELSNHTSAFEYSKDGVEWYSTGTSGVFNLGLRLGEKAYWRCTNPNIDTSNGIGHFNGTHPFKVYGNIMSLVYGDNFEGQTSLSGKDKIFENLFSNNQNLMNAENLVLPATTLANNCYQNMFSNCTSLTTAPELPATELTDRCYSNMFDGCTSLTTAPELSATTLASSCYYGMFQGCTGLTTAPELPATTLVFGCYQYMFNGCTSLNYIKAMFTTTPSTNYTYNWVSDVASTGTFVKNATATWNVRGNSGIPNGWTIEKEYAKIYKKYRATYTNSTTVDGDCDGNNLVINEVTKSGLESVVIGECVPAIVGECFSDCTDLVSVIIEGNTSIDNYSFARNNGHLTSITMYSTTPPSCQSKAFTYYKSGSGYVPMTSITIYVPSQSVNSYKTASGWSTYASKIQAIP